MYTGIMRRIVPLAVLATMSSLVSACRSRGQEEEPEELIEETVMVEPVDDTSFVTVRQIWMTLADDPSVHMRSARELLESGRPRAAARELDKSASLFRWGRRYALGDRERRDFLAAAQELEEMARFIREGSEHGVEPLYHVLANGYRVLAAHHVGLALEQWEAGEQVRVALLVSAASTEVERGFALSGEGAGSSIDESVAAARSVAERLESGEHPTEREVRGALQGLRDATVGLGEVLGSRRR